MKNTKKITPCNTRIMCPTCNVTALQRDYKRHCESQKHKLKLEINNLKQVIDLQKNVDT